jgi:hypothetical protein
MWKRPTGAVAKGPTEMTRLRFLHVGVRTIRTTTPGRGSKWQQRGSTTRDNGLTPGHTYFRRRAGGPL